MSATLCYVDTITHREMRNNSAELLRRVEAGESVLISNHGRTAAVIGPAVAVTLDSLIERGHARVASRGPESLRLVQRRQASQPSSAILDDIRGHR